MELTVAQKREILDRGYVRIPGVVPRVMVDAAMRTINASVGQGMDVERMPIFRSQSYCPEVTKSDAITGLMMGTPAFSLAESAVGAGKLRPVGGGQIALRFPSMADPPSRPSPHLDGMYSPTNGVPQGTIQNFTMLAAVFLSDLPQPFMGNFTAWPGTHQLYERYFRERGPESLLEGMPKIELPEPEQILAAPGDLVLCHYQIAHAAAQNVSPHVRYAIFFRLKCEGHDDRKLDVMKDLWLEWDGIRELVASSL